MTKLKLTLIIHLIFFSAWGIYLLTSVDPNASDIYLETEPVDPRDILSGTYVALSYKISNPVNDSCKNLLKKTKLSLLTCLKQTHKGPKVPFYGMVQSPCL